MRSFIHIRSFGHRPGKTQAIVSPRDCENTLNLNYFNFKDYLHEVFARGFDILRKVLSEGKERRCRHGHRLLLRRAREGINEVF
jgi:hypothetical protein